MRWTNELIESEIKSLMKDLGIDRMPKSMEMRNNGKSGLSRAIGLTGGFKVWAEKLNLEIVVKEGKWNDDSIKSELLKSMEILSLKRMPTAEELKSIGRNDLHCKISRTKKYSGWAAELGIESKKSDTLMGQDWEKKMAAFLEKYEYEVELMTTKHPYDLLVDGVVKVDVKSANPYFNSGQRVHTFNLAKTKPTCDIYILVALDEKGRKERVLVIPSHHVKQKTISLGKNSKYNNYKDKWLTLFEYSKFFNSI